MMRIVHYLNQFFAGVGAEDAAMAAPDVHPGAVGPARRMAALLGEEHVIAATAFCGDDYAAGQPGAIDKIVGLIREQNPDLVVAGPAFTSGRYGLACARVAAALHGEVPVIACMHPDNPGIAEAGAAPVVASGEVGREMKRSLETLAGAVRVLAHGGSLGREHGRIGLVARSNQLASETAAVRAVQAALALARGETPASELVFERFDTVRPAAPVADLTMATIALATEGGLVPAGNPDGLESSRASRWLQYPLPALDSATTQVFESVDGGFNTDAVNRDWRRLLPVDVLCELHAEGRIGGLYDQFLVTTGNGTSVDAACRYGVEWAAECHAHDVQAIVLTAT